MRILIIEDEEMLAQSLKVGLEENGHAVDYVGDGVVGERRLIICAHDYDLAIVDLMLPGKSGIEICKSVRAADVDLPILILTALDQIDDKVEALDSGADDYLVKPFSFKELLARIRALERRPHDVLPEVLTIKDLSLNPATREVIRAGKKIFLTLKEFQLLQLLMKHPNTVMEREEIYVHLWDFADSSMSNVIDVHMKNLRKKIDDHHRDKLFKTVRGVGYSIST
jgi:DNA-binding response OmpR family regulator